MFNIQVSAVKQERWRSQFTRAKAQSVLRAIVWDRKTASACNFAFGIVVVCRSHDAGVLLELSRAVVPDDAI